MLAPVRMVTPQFLLLQHRSPALTMSPCSSKTSKGSHYLSECLLLSPAPMALPVLQAYPTNSGIPKRSSKSCLRLLEHIRCLSFPVTTFTKYSGCQCLQEAVLELLNWT